MNEIDAERRLACAAIIEAALCPDEDNPDDVGPPPCRGCPFFNFCANEPAACADYAHWVDVGEIRNEQRQPTRDLFDFVFGIDPFGESMPQPARQIVLAALSVEATTAGLAHYLEDSGEEPSGIRLYGQTMRRLGVVLGAGAMRTLLSRWPGEIPREAALRWALR